MLISSNIRPDTWSSVSFIVIHHLHDSILVPVDLHAKYSDLLAFAEKEWDLKDQRISFETDELGICPKSLIRIHESAWNGVKDVIGNLYVRVQEPESQTRVLKQASTTGGRLETIKREAGSRAHTESADEDEVEQQTRPESQRSDYVVVAPNQREKSEEPSSPSLPSSSSQSNESSGNPRDALNLFSDELGSKNESVTPLNKDVQSEGDKEERSEAEPTSKVKANAKQASPASTLNSTSSGDSANGAERVLIIVEVAGGDSDARGFRIKREHTINTILKGASKNFSVDPTKACLKIVIDDGDGEITLIKCNSTDTMNSLKIEDGQRFVIEVNEPEEESEESED